MFTDISHSFQNETVLHLKKCRRLERSVTYKSHYQNFTPPFEIPDSWEWVRLGDYLINRDGERIPVSLSIRSKQKNKIYDYYGAAGVIDKVDSFLFNERLLLIGKDGANLISRAKDNAFFADGKYWVNNHAHILDATDKSLLDFVALYINAIALDDYVTGSAQPKLSQESLNRIQMPIPPFAEQIRILNSVQSYSDIIDSINHEKRVIHEAITLIKSKILDLAMQGKLVPQDPTDEPAADMLLRINPKAKIITDNPHYPQNWAVCNIGDVLSVISGVSYSKNDVSVSRVNNIRILRGGNIQDGKLCLCDDDVYVSQECGGDNNDIRNGDTIMVASTGSTLAIGKTAYINSEYDNIHIGAFLRILRPLHNDVSKFLGLFFQSKGYKSKIEELAKGSNINNIKSTYITTMHIGIPPLNEQRRIVSKIGKFYSVLDEIEASLQS